MLFLLCFCLNVSCLCVCVVTTDGSLADSTPLRDRMALYQAAISKQDVNVSVRLIH